MAKTQTTPAQPEQQVTFASYKERIAQIKGEAQPEPEQPKMGFVAKTHLAVTRVQANLAVHKDMHPVMVENAKQQVLDNLIESGAI